MISASHNSFEFNGIKIFDKNGFKLSDEKESEIESLISGEMNSLLPEAKSIGKITAMDNQCKNDYINYLLNVSNISKKFQKCIDNLILLRLNRGSLLQTNGFL